MALQQPHQRGKIGVAAFAERFGEHRGVSQQLLAAFDLAVEDPDGVGFDPPLAIFAEAVADVVQVRHQGFAVSRHAFGAPQGVDLDAVADAQGVEDVLDHQYDGKVFVDAPLAEALAAELVEFPQAPLLGAFVTEHRAVVVETVHPSLAVEFVLDEHPHHAGGPFGPEADVVAPFVDELVHLLADDVAAFADAPFEECRLFQQGSFDIGVAVPFGDAARRLQYVGETFAFGGQDVLHSPQGLDRFAHGRSSFVAWFVFMRCFRYSSIVSAMRSGGREASTTSVSISSRSVSSFIAFCTSSM